ncbi:hypothetical protein HHL19_15655 [Streptomyces sp. R302]|uniref:hypothetical protein n=1 Tax=unclassified Streptomyces TaxID=2593676 RepID=UPI00145D674A|nr:MULTISPECIES: hypothetical protein [unclassified Streptomyces]NML51506.1 hypothetical protein [Streptomyces sp. R301]NML80084.1 hypothetical protein [Streptomyces sp. R302]
MTDDSVTRLLAMLDDLDADVDATIDLADEIAESGDRTVLPRLESELDRAVAERNGYARELLGGLLAALGGPDTLPTLVRASAVDLGDDQDGLATEIVDLVQADPKTAERVLRPLTNDDDLTIANRSDWALRFLP